MPWNESRAKEDADRGNRGFAIAGALISALSWGGVLFLAILILSEWILARSRRERAIFASPLASDATLGRTEVEKMVAELNNPN